MKIYGFPTFNVTKVLLTAEELGLDYEYIALDPLKGETKTPEHLQRHPLGKVPVLEHDGDYYYESAAICRYLARINEPPLYGGNAKEKAGIDQWLDFSTLHIGKWLATFFFQEVVRAKFFGETIDQAQLAEAKEFLDQELPVVDKQLGQSRFLNGEGLSIADIILFSYVQTHEVTSVEIDPYPNLVRWYAEIKQRPSFSAAMSHFPGNKIFG